MTEKDKIVAKKTIAEKIEFVLSELKKDEEYKKLCIEQMRFQRELEIIFEKLERDDRIIISCHYENEEDKKTIELEEMYIQGVNDCMDAFDYLKEKGLILTTKGR